MINHIIEFSIKNKIIIGLFTLALIGWGIYSLTRLPVDAVPDITNNQVQIITITPTLATQEVEKYVTAPVEISVATIPGIIELRSISRLGLSVVTVVFKDNVDGFKARQQINERLKEAEEQIPEGAGTPTLAPVSTGLGEIYQYVLKVKKGYESKYNPMELRSIQDWIVKRELLGTVGVAEVNSYGGFVKEYEVAINPERLKSMNITIPEIFDALEKNNENTGGAYIDKKPNTYFIRGIGMLSSFEDIEKIVIKTNPDGMPILIRDVATVQIGHANRYGAFVVDTTGEGVGGVVMMLKGANGSQVIKNVKERFEKVKKSLPEGIYIEPYLDRTDLVNRAIGTVSRNLLEGGLIVIFILVLMLGNFRAGLVVASVIPLSMLFAVSMMNLFGVSGNLMSLGAIDFGLIVDGAVIIVESVVHRITKSKTHHQGMLKLPMAEMDQQVMQSAKRMMSSATFGQVIILIVYLPILTLVGIEGKMFRPMAQTVSFAILGALILSLTYVPAASTLFLSRNPKIKKDISDKIMEVIQKIFHPLVSFALRKKLTVVFISIALLIGSLFLFTCLGGEFIPDLEEGDLAAGVMTLQGGSLSNTVEIVEKANAILMKNFPEVEHAICKIGSAEIPTDPTPMETGDYIIVMKPKKEWTSAKTREEMTKKMEEKLSALAGVDFSFQQPIQMRFNELMTGSKQDVAVKIFGDNLDSLVNEGERIENMIHNIKRIEDIQVEQITGAPQIHITYNRDKIAQYGLNISNLNQIVRTAFAGSTAGVIFEEEKRFDLVVRLEKQFRENLYNVKNLYIPLPSGKQIPLEEVATVEIKNGTAQVSREDTKRRITVSFNVRNRDVESIVADVQNIIDKKAKLPPGYYVTIGGEFENLIAARERLLLAVPIALLLIFILLFFTFHSLKQTLLIYSAVPLSAIGGIVALYLRGMNFSISAGVGFIALFGVAVLNGIVLIAEFNRLEKEEGITDIYERVWKGIRVRLRPVIMTAAVASLGFLPMSISTSAGAEVQKPLATVVIGGLISSTLLTIIVLPVLYILFFNKKNIKRNIHGITTGVLLIIGFFFFSPSAFAQKTPKAYSLQQAINQAINNNGNIKTARLEVKSQKALKKTAWEMGNTQIDYTYGQINSVKKDDEFSLSQSFQFPAAYATQVRLANAGVASAEIKQAATTAEIAYHVKSTYYQLAFYHSKLQLLRNQDSIFLAFEKAARLRFEKGETNLLEKMNAETQVFEVQNQIKQAEFDIEIYSLKLQILLSENQQITIADTKLPHLQIPVFSDSTLFDQNPDLAYMKQQIEVNKLQTNAERFKLFPEISVGYFNQSNKDISSGERFIGIQAGISFPLLFFSQQGKIQSSAINRNIAEINYNQAHTTLQNDYQILLHEYHKNLNNLQLYESKTLPQAKQITVQAEKAYKSGNIGYMEYVQNLKQAADINSSYLETLNACNQSVLSIELLTGKIN